MPKQYILLHAIGVLYKILAGLSFLTTTGAVLYSAVSSVQLVGLRGDPTWLIAYMIISAGPVLIVGFILMTVFYAFSQVIDLLISLNDHVRSLSTSLQSRPRTELPRPVRLPVEK